jgi:tRNA acetyltransferase TAN1
LLTQFNLLISTSRANERNACSELWYLLGELGDRRANIDVTGIIGLIVAQTEMDPIRALEGLHRKLVEDPWKFRYILKVTPIQRVVPSEILEIMKAALELSERITPEENFRITVEKRHTSLSSKEIIDAIAKKINRSVKLDNPNKIVIVQVIESVTGVSILRSSDILSVEREKRST